MPIALAFFVHYAYAILFLWVLVEQLGVPIPSLPVLLTAGALSATHRISFQFSILAVLMACLVADSVWYYLGRRFGNAVSSHQMNGSQIGQDVFQPFSRP